MRIELTPKEQFDLLMDPGLVIVRFTGSSHQEKAPVLAEKIENVLSWIKKKDTPPDKIVVGPSILAITEKYFYTVVPVEEGPRLAPNQLIFYWNGDTDKEKSTWKEVESPVEITIGGHPIKGLKAIEYKEGKNPDWSESTVVVEDKKALLKSMALLGIRLNYGVSQDGPISCSHHDGGGFFPGLMDLLKDTPKSEWDEAVKEALGEN